MTVFGVLTILLSLFLLLNRKLYFIWYGVSCAFFNSTVFFLGATPIRLHIITTILLLVFARLDHFRNKDFQRLIFVSAIFFSALLLSQFFSYYLPSNIEVTSNDQAYSEIDNRVLLRNDRGGFITFLFPFFNFLQVLIVFLVVKRVRDILFMLKGVLLSGILVIGMSLVNYYFQFINDLSVYDQLITFINESHSRSSTSDYNAVAGIKRVFTFVGEPGFTGRYYLFIASFIVLAKLKGLDIGINRNLFISLLIILIMVLGSTAGYIGIPLYMFLILIYSKNRIIKNRFYFAILVIIAFSPLLLSHVNNFDIVNEHLGKLSGDSGSGIVRFENIRYSITTLFSANPLTGIGFSNHRAISFITQLISNTGIIGVVSFMLYYAEFFRKVHIPITHNSLNYQFIKEFFRVNVTVFLVYYFLLDTATFNFGWVWMILGLSVAFRRIMKEIKSQTI